MSFPPNKQKGFTLLETLVAVFILSLALTGPIYIATLAIRTSVSSRDGISARYLAEEVVEVVRNIRDYHSLIGSSDWLSDFEDCDNPPGVTTSVCELEIDNINGQHFMTPCPAGLGNCPKLSFTPNGGWGFYGFDDGTLTFSKFSREFYLQTAPQDGSLTENPNREVKIVVNIRWNDHGQNKVYTLEENLFNVAYKLHVQ